MVRNVLILGVEIQRAVIYRGQVGEVNSSAVCRRYVVGRAVPEGPAPAIIAMFKVQHGREINVDPLLTQ